MYFWEGYVSVFRLSRYVEKGGLHQGIGDFLQFACTLYPFILLSPHLHILCLV